MKATDLTSDEDIRRTNLRWYIKDCEGAINMNVQPESNKKTLFKSTLRVAVAQWGRLRDPSTYTHLRTLFVERFWSKEIQRQIVSALQSESYMAARDGAMEAYFLKGATHARYLDEPRDDAWIFEQLKFHFWQRVCNRLELLRPKDIWEARQILTKIDGYALQTTQRRPRNDNKGETEPENWKSRRQEETEDGRQRNNRN